MQINIINRLIARIIINRQMRKLLRDRIHPRKPSHRRAVPPRPVLVEVDLVVGAELLAIIQVLILPEAAFGAFAADLTSYGVPAGGIAGKSCEPINHPVPPRLLWDNPSEGALRKQ